MDRLGVSKLLEDIRNQGYEYLEEPVSEVGQEILNVARDFAEKKIMAYIDYIEEQAERVLHATGEEYEWIWNEPYDKGKVN